MSVSETCFNDDQAIDVKPKLIKLKRLKPKAQLKCVLCQEQFTDPPALKEHFRKHGDTTALKYARINRDTPVSGGIPCEFCPLVLPTISAAIAHKYRKHRCEGSNYSCENCGGLFPIHVALEKHKEKCTQPTGAPQTSSKPVIKIKEDPNIKSTCKFCPAVFLSPEALTFHQKHAHRTESDLMENVFLPPPSTKIRVNHNSEVYSVYYCYLCGSAYCVKFNLKKHLLTAHAVEERTKPPEDCIIRCKLCEGLFYTKSAYDAHSVHHGDDDLYVVSEEHRRQVVNRIDQDFDISRVPPKIEPHQPVRRSTESRRRPGTSLKVENVDDESMSPPSSVSDSSDEEASEKADTDKRERKKRAQFCTLETQDVYGKNSVKNKHDQKKLPPAFASQPSDKDFGRKEANNKRAQRKRPMPSASESSYVDGSEKAVENKQGQNKLPPSAVMQTNDKCSKKAVQNKKGQKKR